MDHSQGNNASQYQTFSPHSSCDDIVSSSVRRDSQVTCASSSDGTNKSPVTYTDLSIHQSSETSLFNNQPFGNTSISNSRTEQPANITPGLTASAEIHTTSPLTYHSFAQSYEASAGSLSFHSPGASTTYQSVESASLLQDDLRSEKGSGRCSSATDSEKTVLIEQNYDLLADQHTKTSNLQCLMHLLKGNIGPGILALPVAVTYIGLWAGFVGILCVCGVATHCMHILVRCSNNLCKRHCVNCMVIFAQFGLCCVYIVFIATKVRQQPRRMTNDELVFMTLIVIPAIHGVSAVITTFRPNTVDVRVYEVVTVVVIVPYAMLQSLRVLAPFSSIANLATLTGLVIIFQYLIANAPDPDKRPAFTSIERLPLFLGTAFFAIEGITLVLPLEHSMRTPGEFSGWTGVLNTGMVIVSCLFAAMAFFGYLCFGEDTLGSITLNLPNDDWLYLSVKLVFCFVVYVSYAIQFYVPINIIWPYVHDRLPSYTLRTYGEYIVRLVFVLVTAAIAILVPHLDLLIALVGAFACSSLAIVFPAVIEFFTVASESDRPCMVTLVKDMLLIITGFIAFATGTYSAVRDIVLLF